MHWEGAQAAEESIFYIHSERGMEVLPDLQLTELFSFGFKFSGLYFYSSALDTRVTFWKPLIRNLVYFQKGMLWLYSKLSL